MRLFGSNQPGSSKYPTLGTVSLDLGPANTPPLSLSGWKIPVQAVTKENEFWDKLLKKEMFQVYAAF